MNLPEGRALYDSVIGRLSSLGITVPTDSRFIRLGRSLLAEGSKVEHISQRLEAMRDFSQMNLIVELLEVARRRSRTVPSFIEIGRRLEKSFEDNSDPLDSENTPGRNMQTELFAASVCLRAGLTPVSFGNPEPDVICTFGGKRLGLAVKRVKSASQVVRRIGEGIKQLTESGVPGIVLVDGSLAVNNENSILRQQLSPDTSQFIRLHQVKEGFLDDKAEKLVKRMNKHVLGFVFCEHQKSIENDGSEKIIGLWHRIHNPARATRFYQFYQRFFTGLPNGGFIPLVEGDKMYQSVERTTIKRGDPISGILAELAADALGQGEEQ